MVGCDTCGEWYHPKCIGLTVQIVKSWESAGVSFHCSKCQGTPRYTCSFRMIFLLSIRSMTEYVLTYRL